MNSPRFQKKLQETDDGENGSSSPFGGGGPGAGGRRSLIIWILLALVAATLFFNPFAAAGDGTRISYSTFRQHVQNENVARITVKGQEITGELKNPSTTRTTEGESAEYTRFKTFMPSFGDESLLEKLETKGVEVQAEPESEFSWWQMLVNLLPFLLLIWLAYIFISRMRTQGQNIFSMGQSRAQLYDRSRERTSFDDVAGAQGAKTELREVIEFLKDPDRFQTLGGEIPRGVLMVGPPGTGKTLLARAVAGEADVPFYSITGSDFMEMLVGVGASRVRNLFKEAKKNSPAIVFIDELDSIGRRRGAGLGGGHDEREQTLNQLLSEMDGFEPNESVIVMAATNRPDILDRALLRPGRFDRQITVNLPTMKNREEILKIHAKNKPLADDVDLREIARGTPGFSGADLKNLLNEAALLAARVGKKAIEKEDVEEARDKVLMGLERETMAISDEEKEMLAYHEAGHAVLAAVLPHSDPIHKVTIVPRGQAMGVTQQLPEREKYIYQREYMLDRLAVMMGGRAAEELIFDTVTSGAENDLKQATKLTRKMIMDWGMSEKLGPVAMGGEQDEVFLGEELTRRKEFSEDTAREIDRETKRMLMEAFDRASETLAGCRDGLDRLVDVLLEDEEISGDRVLEILGIDKEEAYQEPPGESDGAETAEAGEPEPEAAASTGTGSRETDRSRSTGPSASSSDQGSSAGDGDQGSSAGDGERPESSSVRGEEADGPERPSLSRADGERGKELGPSSSDPGNPSSKG